MARKKVVEEEIILTEEVEEVLADIQPAVEAEIVEVLEPVISEPIVEIIEKPTVKPKLQKIKIVTGNSAIADLRFPMGYSQIWKEDIVVAKRIEPRSQIDIVVPNECDLKSWVKYYQSLNVLGVRVIKFGVE